MIAFEFEGERYPISPMTVFYDWLYFKALYPHGDWIEKRTPPPSGATGSNCQARSFAAFVALQKRDELDATVARFQNFKTRWELAGL